MDPSAITPAIVLTLAGGTIVATGITGLIAVLRGAIPAIAERSLEKPMALILSAAAVAYAYVMTIHTPDAVGILGAIIAFVGISQLSEDAYQAGTSRGILATGAETRAAAQLKDVGADLPVESLEYPAAEVAAPVEVAPEPVVAEPAVVDPAA